MPTFPLTRSAEPRVATVAVDDVLRDALRPFDLDADEPTTFYPFERPDEMPTDFGVGLIVGASGSGKSTFLSHFGEPESPEWVNGFAIASHFDTGAEAADKFYAVGLSSVPAWRQSYDTLSNGQRFRADLARSLHDGAVIDEFTSVVDRTVAISAARSVRAYIERAGLRRVVFASCHRDVVDWLRPDWLVDTDAGTLTVGEAADAPKWWAQYVKGDEVARVFLG